MPDLNFVANVLGPDGLCAVVPVRAADEDAACTLIEQMAEAQEIDWLHADFTPAGRPLVPGDAVTVDDIQEQFASHH